MAGRVEVTCPCCSARLTVEAETGEILAFERPKVDHEKTFESAMDSVRGGASRRDELFSKAFDKTRRLDDLLEKKFEEAKKKADQDPRGRPRGPFDLD